MVLIAQSAYLGFRQFLRLVALASRHGSTTVGQWGTALTV
jgi:hypothetical protein